MIEPSIRAFFYYILIEHSPQEKYQCTDGLQFYVFEFDSFTINK